MSTDETPESTRWLLLIHQLPAKPAYARVKIWRRLKGLGAVTVKNSVYALPANAETQEDFAWLVKEIAELGGEAFVCEALLVDGIGVNSPVLFAGSTLFVAVSAAGFSLVLAEDAVRVSVPLAATVLGSALAKCRLRAGLLSTGDAAAVSALVVPTLSLWATSAGAASGT